jgi:RNA polymerase sigma factor (TIGR02999 family)
MTAKGDEVFLESPESKRQLDEVFSLVYEELRRLASFIRGREARLTINSTALVDEAWLKLRGSPHLAATSATHFKAIAAGAMRQVLVDEARRRYSRKRGGNGEVVFVRADSFEDVAVPADLELLELDAALEELKRMNPRQAKVVETRFFGGMDVEETAQVMNVSRSLVERDWRVARAWLATRIRPGKQVDHGK